MPQFDTKEFYVTYTNTGNMPWFRDVVRLGTQYNSDWALFNSFHNFDDTNIVEFRQNYARIQMQDDGPIMPGQDATFRFTLTANFGALPNSGVVFNLVADKALGLAKAGWFSDDSRTYFDVKVTQVTDPGALSAYVAYQDPKNIVIKRGESAQAFLEIINTGKIVWPPDTVVLATTNPNLRISRLYTKNDSWASPSYIFMTNDAPVRPNEPAFFSFSLTPDNQFVSGDEQFQLYVSIPFVQSWWIPGSLVTFRVTVTD